jgi:L(+)-tartrate dehydratase alpha subunit
MKRSHNGSRSTGSAEALRNSTDCSGLSSMYDAATTCSRRRASPCSTGSSGRLIADETAKSHLRPTIVHPISGKNPGTNVGLFYPKVEITFDPDIDFVEILFLPKGSGSEIFGNFFKMLVAADGLPAIKEFVFDSFMASCYSGATCPPNIVGIGIGGTAEDCMRIAKEAAVLRPIGDRNPDPEIAALEEEFLAGMKEKGFGAMGFPGLAGVLDVHIECALVHTGGLPVAYSAQCIIGRRKKAHITSNGEVKYDNGGGWMIR